MRLNSSMGCKTFGESMMNFITIRLNHRTVL